MANATKKINKCQKRKNNSFGVVSSVFKMGINYMNTFDSKKSVIWKYSKTREI